MLRAASIAQSAWRIAVGISAERFLFEFDDLLLKVLLLTAHCFLSVVSSPVVRSLVVSRRFALCAMRFAITRQRPSAVNYPVLSPSVCG